MFINSLLYVPHFAFAPTLLTTEFWPRSFSAGSEFLVQIMNSVFQLLKIEAVGRVKEFSPYFLDRRNKSTVAQLFLGMYTAWEFEQTLQITVKLKSDFFRSIAFKRIVGSNKLYTRLRLNLRRFFNNLSCLIQNIFFELTYIWRARVLWRRKRHLSYGSS